MEKLPKIPNSKAQEKENLKKEEGEISNNEKDFEVMLKNLGKRLAHPITETAEETAATHDAAADLLDRTIAKMGFGEKESIAENSLEIKNIEVIGKKETRFTDKQGKRLSAKKLANLAVGGAFFTSYGTFNLVNTLLESIPDKDFQKGVKLGRLMIAKLTGNSENKK